MEGDGRELSQANVGVASPLSVLGDEQQSHGGGWVMPSAPSGDSVLYFLGTETSSNQGSRVLFFSARLILVNIFNLSILLSSFFSKIH